MAKKSLVVKARRVRAKPKYKTRIKNRCNLCGRAKGYMRKFGLCRICFREKASSGEIPGISKASW